MKNKVKLEAPDLSTKARGVKSPEIKALVEAAMENRGEWVSVPDENGKLRYTAVRSRVGSLFCEFSVAGGEKMFLRIKTEDEL